MKKIAQRIFSSPCIEYLKLSEVPVVGSILVILVPTSFVNLLNLIAKISSTYLSSPCIKYLNLSEVPVARSITGCAR